MTAATIFLLLLWISSTSSTEWCRAAGVPAPFVDSFVKMTATVPGTLSPQQRLLKYESPGNVVTAECHNRCRDSLKCPAFIVDYVRGACYFVAPESDTSWNRVGAAVVADAPTVGFFERACFRSKYFAITIEVSMLGFTSIEDGGVHLNNELRYLCSTFRLRSSGLGDREGTRLRSRGSRKYGEYPKENKQSRLRAALSRLQPLNTSVQVCQVQCDELRVYSEYRGQKIAA